jgi:hypothetical protein
MAGIRLLAEYRQDSPGSSSSNRNGSFRFEKDVSPESSSSDQRELRRIPANKDAAAAPLEIPQGFTKDGGRRTRDVRREFLKTWIGACGILPQAPMIGITLPCAPVYQIAAQRSGCDLERTFRRNLRAFALARMRSIPANKDAIPANKDAGRYDHSAWIILA